MKKILLPALILVCYIAHSQNVGIGTGSPAAKLDITSSTSGVLIPRVALTATNSASPLSSPTTSTLVYNTATAGSSPYAVVPGFYYWNATAGTWVQIIDNSSLTGSTTVGNTSSANMLSTTVNGVTGATVPIVNSISDASSGNTLSTTVNGVAGSTVPIINTNTLIQNGSNQLTSTINGIAAGPTTLNIAGDVTGSLGTSTVAGIQGTPVTVSSLAGGNILQYNSAGTDWVNVTPASILGAATTVGNTSSANTLSTTVNGVTGSTVPMVNSIGNTSSANTLSTTVNGVAGSTVPIINTNTLIQNGSNQLTSTINGIAAGPTTLNIAGDVTGSLGTSTVAGIQGTPVTVSSLAGGNILQYNSAGTDWVNVTPASILGAATTVGNTSSANTLSTTVNGVTGSTVPMVNSIGNTSSANTLSTTVNGVAGSTVPMVNSIGNTSSANTLSTTVNGVAGSTVPIVNSIGNASSGNTLSTTVNGITGSTVPIVNSIGNTSSANTLSTTVNGVAGSTVPIVNSIGNASSANTLSTTVNGVAGSTVPIINSHTLSLSGNTLTSNVNGVAPTQSLSGLTLSGDVTGSLGASTVAGIQGKSVTLSSLANGNLLQYNSAGTDWVNVTPAIAANGSFILNQTSQQASSNFNISGIGIIGGNATISGGSLSLNNGTSNAISFSDVGVAAPAFNTASAGEKIAFYSQESSTTVDYSMGISNGTLWYAVPQAISTYQHIFYAGTTPLVTMLGSGNVGIGTTGPIGNLDIEATTANTYGHLVVNRTNATAVGGELSIDNFGGGTGASAVLAFGTDNSTTFDGSGNNQSNAEIRAVNDNGTTNATDLHFSNWSGSAENINMDITSSGNVGIGTVSPGSLLQVGSGTIAWATLPGINVAIAGAAYIAASNGTMTTFMGADASGYGMVGAGSNNDFVLRANNTEWVRIQAAGNIGIGQSSPTQKLDVAGNVTIEGNYIMGSSYNQDMIRMANDGNWTFGGYHSGSSYFMQATYYDQGANPSGFRVLDRNSGNTVFSTNVAGTSVSGVLTLGSTISSPKFRVTSVWSQNSGLPAASSFTSGGGTLLICVSGSGYNTAGGLIGINVLVGGTQVGQCKAYTNEVSSHKAYNSDFIVVTGLAAGSHTIQLTLWSGTYDANDFFSASVLELPF